MCSWPICSLRLFYCFWPYAASCSLHLTFPASSPDGTSNQSLCLSSVLFYIMHDSARCTERNRQHIKLLFDNSSTTLGIQYIYVLLRWHVRLNKHLAELPQLLRATDFLSEQRKLDDVEEFVVKFMCFAQIFLLHLVTHVAVFAVRC